MGWKAIKEHYEIGHDVTVTDEGICIGSPYIHNLITIKPDGSLEQCLSGIGGNRDLVRYWEQMKSDPKKLVELLNQSDQFSRSIPVYTYCEGTVIEKYCEETGWPNVTHDGEMMYENTFFAERTHAVSACYEDAKLALKYAKERVIRDVKTLETSKKNLADREEELALAEIPTPTNHGDE